MNVDNLPNMGAAAAGAGVETGVAAFSTPKMPEIITPTVDTSMTTTATAALDNAVASPDAATVESQIATIAEPANLGEFMEQQYAAEDAAKEAAANSSIPDDVTDGAKHPDGALIANDQTAIADAAAESLIEGGDHQKKTDEGAVNEGDAPAIAQAAGEALNKNSAPPTGEAVTAVAATSNTSEAAPQAGTAAAVEAPAVAETAPATQPITLIDRQSEVNQNIQTLEAKGEERTPEENAQLATLQSNKAELDEFSALQHKKRNEGNMGKLTDVEQKRHDELDAKLNPKTEGENNVLTTDEQKKQLDQELQSIQKELMEGKITPQQANERLNRNQNARESLIHSLVKRLEASDSTLSPFEREVAEKAQEMQQLMYEIQMAPQIMKSMEGVITKQKQEFRKAAQFEISPENANTPEARKNIALRSGLANQIAGQATLMAQFTDVTKYNTNEFYSVNSRLMRLMGVRGVVHDSLVQVGTNIARISKKYTNDARARNIVQSA